MQMPYVVVMWKLGSEERWLVGMRVNNGAFWESGSPHVCSPLERRDQDAKTSQYPVPPCEVPHR